MTRGSAVMFVVVGVLGVTGVSGIGARESSPQNQRPVRDVRTEAVGAGVIGGVVREAGDSMRPLRRAAVRLSGERLLTSRQTHTRDDGTFAFEGLAAGSYTVVASRATYMSAEHGARRPGGSGSALVLGEGERRTDLIFRLSRYASITGVIYDQDGEPAAGVSVEALKYTMRTGRRTLSSVYGQPSTTDDRGVYRLGGLSPGQYDVAAGPSPDRGPADLQRLSVSDIDRVLQLLSAATSGSSVPVTFSEPHQGYAPVYFPGSTEFASAQPIALVVGEERAGVDIRLQLVRTARIDGTLMAADNRALAGTRVTATPVTEASSLDLFSPAALGFVIADTQGQFSFPAVAPGRYVVTARLPGLPGGQVGPLWASADVTVGGANQTIALGFQSGMSVSGKVVFAGTLAPPKEMATVRVSLTNAQWSPSSFFSDPLGVAPVGVTPDGGFAMTGVPPGQYWLTPAPPVAPPGWALRSAMVSGVDVLDGPLSIAPGRSIDNVVVTFTDRPTELSGTLQTSDGSPTSDYFIIVFAADRAFWGPSARRSVSARPASTGRYVVRNLPPGDYLIAAVTDVELNEWFDPAFLERLVPAATRITIAESEKKTLDLKIR